jgi:TetR/AcrR family transcriptional repressor of nem operon
MNIKHNKELVINKGLELFRSEGYHALGIDKICKITGMTKGAFYNAFKSKENFFLVCLETYFIRGRDFLTLSLNNDKTAFDAVKNFYFQLLNIEQDKCFSGCLINNIMSELGGSNKAINQVTNTYFNSLIDVIEPKIKEAQIEGSIKNNFDSRQVAELLHSTFFGVLTRLKGSSNNEAGVNTMQLLFNSIKI